MTTNNPEVAAYLHINKENPEHRGVSLHHDASCTSTLTNTEPLIRLSDYEALQAELARELQRRFDGNEQASREHRADVSALVEALEDIAQWAERWTSTGHPVAAIARKALEDFSQGGGE